VLKALLNGVEFQKESWEQMLHFELRERLGVERVSAARSSPLVLDTTIAAVHLQFSWLRNNASMLLLRSLSTFFS